MRKELEELAEDLSAWLPSLPEEAATLILRLLASLPGGEELEEFGYEPFPLGWKEAELVAKALSVPQTSEEVAWLVRALLKELPLEGGAQHNEE